MSEPHSNCILCLFNFNDHNPPSVLSPEVCGNCINTHNAAMVNVLQDLDAIVSEFEAAHARLFSSERSESTVGQAHLQDRYEKTIAPDLLSAVRLMKEARSLHAKLAWIEIRQHTNLLLRKKDELQATTNAFFTEWEAFGEAPIADTRGDVAINVPPDENRRYNFNLVTHSYWEEYPKDKRLMDEWFSAKDYAELTRTKHLARVGLFCTFTRRKGSSLEDIIAMADENMSRLVKEHVEIKGLDPDTEKRLLMALRAMRTHWISSLSQIHNR